MGLNDTYVSQRSQILMMHPTPSLNQAYSMIIQEESQRKNSGLTTQGRILGIAPVDIDHTALASANSFNVKPKRNAGLYCDYCKMKVHTREGCYKLIGYLPGFKFTNKKRGSYEQPAVVAHNVTIGEEVHTGMHRNDIPTIQPFTAEQYQQILKLLNKEKDPDASTNMAVYPVPKPNHLLYIYLMEIVLKLLILDYDLFSGMVKGIGKLKGGLYILNPSTPVTTSASNCVPASVQSNSSALWHQRLGHAPLAVLKKIPDLNKQLSYITICHCHFSTPVKTFRLDNGHEFFNTLCSNLFKTKGIIHQRCLCYATKPDFHDKFTPKFAPGVFMGYATTQKGYRIYDINANKFIVSRDVIFHENVYPFKHPRSKFLATHDPYSTSSPLFPNSDPLPSFTPDHDSISNDIISPPNDPGQSSISPTPSSDPISSPPSTVLPSLSDPPTDSLLPRKSGRTLKPSIWLADYIHPHLSSASTSCLYPIHHFASYNHLPNHFQSFLSSFSADIEPTSYSHAIKYDR
ncbi:uncharacterized protein [Nicotiana tomentosiformis]|uniref:uncharacterized protein n=1 Tax=Nicotiana tomentosiformis TaxID=4098 RepID=UPI00388C7DD4